MYGARLREHGISTLEDLRAASTAEIETAAGCNRQTAAHWKAMAALLRIDALGPQEAELLALTGVSGPRALAHQEPRPLFNGVRTVLQLRPHVYPGEVDLDSVRSWINAARIHARGADRPTPQTPPVQPMTSTTGPATTTA